MNPRLRQIFQHAATSLLLGLFLLIIGAKSLHHCETTNTSKQQPDTHHKNTSIANPCSVCDFHPGKDGEIFHKDECTDGLMYLTSWRCNQMFPVICSVTFPSDNKGPPENFLF